MAHRQRGRRRRYRGGLVAQVFDEAQRRDPTHARRWVALVDGANHQLDRIEAEAKARKVNVFVLIDVIHVLKYLWKAVFIPRATRTPRPGYTTKHGRCWPDGRPASPAPSGAPPPTAAWTKPRAKAPTSARGT